MATEQEQSQAVAEAQTAAQVAELNAAAVKAEAGAAQAAAAATVEVAAAEAVAADLVNPANQPEEDLETWLQEQLTKLLADVGAMQTLAMDSFRQAMLAAAQAERETFRAEMRTEMATIAVALSQRPAEASIPPAVAPETLPASPAPGAGGGEPPRRRKLRKI